MPVNLLTTVPSVVAVSSTVDNKTILPEHLVDGKLDTAWNSRTNELAGSWVAVRVPADVHVDEIRLTVGFTKVDKKLGDLFTMNPRIKRVRVSRYDKVLFEKDLDVENRALQVLPINGTGGDYKIEVVDFVAGTKKTWREMPISELEVWGTLAPNALPGKEKPVIRIGSLDKLPLTQAECAKALGVTGTVVDFSVLALAGDYEVCRVDTQGDDETAVAVGVVKRGTRPVLVGVLPALAVYEKQNVSQPLSGTENEDRKLTLSIVPFAINDILLRVDDEQSTWDPINVNANTTSTLYRVSGGAVKPILVFQSSESQSDGVGTSDSCDIVEPPIGPTPPAKLEVHCIKRSNEPYPGKTTKTTERTLRFRWTGSSYTR